jgi:hypothetical protein
MDIINAISIIYFGTGGDPNIWRELVISIPQSVLSLRILGVYRVQIDQVKFEPYSHLIRIEDSYFRHYCALPLIFLPLSMVFLVLGALETNVRVTKLQSPIIA